MRLVLDLISRFRTGEIATLKELDDQTDKIFISTASLSFPEGYTQAVAKVEATEEYHELVHRLSLPSSQHPART